MTEAKARERFTHLQTKAQQAVEALRAYAIDLRVKYGDGYYRGWCSRAEQRKYDQLTAAESKASDRFFAYLDTIATRQFRSGVPAHWIVEELTYDDATTRAAMSTVPPAAYGYAPSDSLRFAAALQEA